MIQQIARARDMSALLQAWQRGRGYTDAEAAAVIGIDQGVYIRWRDGFPVPYPSLVEAAIGVPVVPQGVLHG